MVLVVLLGEELLGVREVQVGRGHQVDQALRGELVVKFLAERVVLADLVHREGREHHLDLEAAHLAGLVDLGDLARPAEEHLVGPEEHQEEDRLDREEHREEHQEEVQLALVVAHPAAARLVLELLEDWEEHLEEHREKDHLDQVQAVHQADREEHLEEEHLVDQVQAAHQADREEHPEKVQLALVVAHPAAARLVLELLEDREEHLVEHREKDHLDQVQAAHQADREEHLEEEHPEVHLALEEEHLVDQVQAAHQADREEQPEDLAEKPLEVPAEPAEPAEWASLAERDRIPQLILGLAHRPALALAQEQVHMVL